MFDPKLVDQEPLLQFFDSAGHGSTMLVVSQTFASLAQFLVTALPKNQDRTEAIRKLLESRDAAMRAKTFLAPTPR